MKESLGNDIQIESFFKAPPSRAKDLDDYSVNIHCTAKDKTEYTMLTQFFAPLEEKIALIKSPKDNKVIVCDVNTPDKDKQKILQTLGMKK